MAVIKAANLRLTDTPLPEQVADAVRMVLAKLTEFPSGTLEIQVANGRAVHIRVILNQKLV